MADPSSNSSSGPAESAGRLMVVDDDPGMLDLYRAILGEEYHLHLYSTAEDALEELSHHRFDLAVCDLSLPGLDGIALLRLIRKHDLYMPVVLATGAPSVETAIEAVEFGALRYLVKPFSAAELLKVVRFGLGLGHMAVARRRATEHLTGRSLPDSDRAGREAVFERAMRDLRLDFQPIISWSEQRTVGYEALLRTGEELLASPERLIDAAEELDRGWELGRAVRRMAAAAVRDLEGDIKLFVNLRPDDLNDPELIDATAPLSKVAPQVVLEVTERESFDVVTASANKVACLRLLGFGIAMDDLGAGDNGLVTFARLEPDVVKLDMLLVQGADRDQVQQMLVRSLCQLCQELNTRVIGEGIETHAQRDALVDAGCDLMQGYLFGMPRPGFHEGRFENPAPLVGP
ncbi:MAG: EAL domain-containing protein [Planctomycetes bacterium]|nr:EAL domain-containing protein [Planctomycetota bacterium]